jgi:hypothetical protein
MKRFLIPALLTLSLVLAACTATATPVPSNLQPFDQTQGKSAPVSNITPTLTDDPAIIPTLFPNMSGDGGMARLDQQGAVVVEVTPLDLGTPADTLEFNVAMNTHSVDLSMDLATLATLMTDTGVTVQATTWDAPRGGHHVSGKLIFPTTKDGKSILEGASKLTLTIINVDVPSRVFEWELK